MFFLKLYLDKKYFSMFVDVGGESGGEHEAETGVEWCERRAGPGQAST